MTSPSVMKCEEFVVATESGLSTTSLTFTLERGESVAILGPAGSGKSLILERFSEVKRPRVQMRGRLEAGRTSFVPQDARLAALPTDRVWSLLGLSGLGVFVDVTIGTRWPTSPSEDRARELMQRLRLDPDRLADLPFRDLSHSERRRILLCRALLDSPEILVYDAWDEGSDALSRQAICAVLEERMAAGLAVVLAARRYPLRGFANAKVMSLALRGEQDEAPLPLLTKFDPPEPHHRPLLELNRLSVSRPRRTLFRPRPPALPVDGATLAMKKGETLVLLGSAGSGKTTLLQAVAGLLVPARGRIFVSGRDVTHARGGRADRLRRDVQLVFQDAASALDGPRTVEDHLREAAALSRSPTSAPAAEWLERLGLAPHLLRSPADQLSASESQRVDLARSLIVEPRLVLYDAPEVSGVLADGGLVASVLRAEKVRGRSFLAATSDPDVARSLADRIAVLHKGRIIEVGTAHDVLNRPGHPVTEVLVSGGDLAVTDPTVPCRGCPHTPKCARRLLPQCSEQEPALAPLLYRPSAHESVLPGEHRTACFHPLEH